jgi:acyl-homoserine lactone acylase PvdQ
MNRARKALIVTEATVSEFEHGVADAINNLADAVRTVGGVFASVAAGMNTDTVGDQRNMAGVIFQDAQQRFGDLLKKLDPKTQKQLESWIDGLCKGKR